MADLEAGEGGGLGNSSATEFDTGNSSSASATESGADIHGRDTAIPNAKPSNPPPGGVNGQRPLPTITEDKTLPTAVVAVAVSVSGRTNSKDSKNNINFNTDPTRRPSQESFNPEIQHKVTEKK